MKSNLRKKILGCLVIVALIATGIVLQIGKVNKNSNNLKQYLVVDDNKEDIAEPEKTKIKLTSVGNIIYHDKLINGAKTQEGYDFNPNLEYVKDRLTNSNLSIGIIEGAIAGGTPSGYPYFNAPDEVLDSINNNGIDIINFASNHIVDMGANGFIRTMKVSREKDIDFIGVRERVNEKKYIVQEVKGHKIGFISYTYETPKIGGNKAINSIQVPKRISNLINSFNYGNLEGFYSDINQNIVDMKNEGVDFVIASIHWGEEYCTKENQTQRNMAKRLSEMGIDIILGGHPHVIQPYEIIENSNGKNTFIAYSQGNYLSNQCYEELKNDGLLADPNLTEDGLMIDFNLEEDKNGKLFLKGYEVTPTWVYREPKGDGRFTHRVIPVELALQDKEKYKLSDEAFNRAQKSLERTKNIVGNIGVQEVNQK